MPVQRNFAIQNTPRLVWNGKTSRPIDIRKHVGFAFSFEVTTTLTADAVFNIEAAPASAADTCVAGKFFAVPEMPSCEGGAEPGPQATVTIPSGTVAGTVCTGTIPCRPDAFVRLVGVTSTTSDVIGAAVLHGPKI